MISPHTEGDDALPLTDGEIVYTAFTVTWNAESYLSTLWRSREMDQPQYALYVLALLGLLGGGLMLIWTSTARIWLWA
jgi:hypothetical protein